MDIVGILIIAFMFFLRIGVPLLLVVGIGYSIERWQQSRAEQVISHKRARGERLCWEIKQCDPAQRLLCPAFLRPEEPCWKVWQRKLGELRPLCLNCELYEGVEGYPAYQQTA